MKLFENDKLTKVNQRIKELEDKKAAVQGEMKKILEAIEKTIESYAVGDVDEKDVEKAKELLEAKKNEIKEIDELIQRVKAVRKSVVVESVPLVREWRQKQVETIQSEINKAVQEALKARENYVHALAKIGQAAKKIDAPNAKYNAIMREIGEREINDGVNFPPIYPEQIMIGLYGSTIEESTAIGLSKETQEAAVKKGILPNWVGDSN
ncbi:hypothetical protein P4482_15220 [Neobacillus thermocopriae]|jgi:DNA repair exonuclease SbcCD ATPase subunit|uniref:hypothetical protein n=1 Tax=Neobacillus thermocopriae TaxID=1215031 RepID=UPI002E23F63B|nr:hypothetical protein [Neobacillus thermocopriae]MED3715538.1 hypothetical protein [Neobacillus thermocopriae]